MIEFKQIEFTYITYDRFVRAGIPPHAAHFAGTVICAMISLRSSRCIQDGKRSHSVRCATILFRNLPKGISLIYIFSPGQEKRRRSSTLISKSPQLLQEKPRAK